MAPATAPVSETSTEVFRAISIEQFVPSPTNPRKHFDAKKLDELADSIRQKGVVVPLLVRQIGKGVPRFEIVAGERRYRAAKLAGLTGLQAIVRDLSDQDVLELQLIENIQRDDLDPLEEARGYKALIDSNPAKFSAAYIADRIGRSEKFVWDRMRLLDMIPEAQELLNRDVILVGHAELLAKLKAEDQKRAIKLPTYVHGSDGGGLFERRSATLPIDDPDAKKDKYRDYKAVSVREFEYWITRHVRLDIEHAASAAPLDFGPLAEQVKTAQEKPGRRRKVISITKDYTVHPDARDESDRTWGRDHWKRVGAKACDSQVFGVIVAGEGRGHAFDVCVNKDCTIHWAEEARERKKRAAKAKTSSRAATKTESPEAKAKREAKEAAARREREAAEKRRAQLEVRAVIAAAAGVKTLKGDLLRLCVASACGHALTLGDEQDGQIAKAIGVPPTAFQFGVDEKELRKLSDQQLTQLLVASTVADAITNTYHGEDLTTVLKPYGVDVTAIEKALLAEEQRAESAAKSAKKAKAKR